jgi:hypothetical protein
VPCSILLGVKRDVPIVPAMDRVDQLHVGDRRLDELRELIRHHAVIASMRTASSR